MANGKWVDSAIEIPDLKKKYRPVEGVVIDDFQYGTMIEKITLPKGKPVEELGVKDVCIENGLVLAKKQKFINFLVDGLNEERSLSCTPVKNLPGVYYTSEVTTEKDNPFAPDKVSDYFMVIDARILARHLSVFQKELKVLQRSFIDEDGKVLKIKDADGKIIDFTKKNRNDIDKKRFSLKMRDVRSLRPNKDKVNKDVNGHEDESVRI